MSHRKHDGLHGRGSLGWIVEEGRGASPTASMTRHNKRILSVPHWWSRNPSRGFRSRILRPSGRRRAKGQNKYRNELGHCFENVAVVSVALRLEEGPPGPLLTKLLRCPFIVGASSPRCSPPWILGFRMNRMNPPGVDSFWFRKRSQVIARLLLNVSRICGKESAVRTRLL